MIDSIFNVHQDIYNDELWRSWGNKVDAFTPTDNPEFGRDLGTLHWFNISHIASCLVIDVGGSEYDATLADIAGLFCGCGLVDGFADYPDNSAKMAYDYLTARYYGTALNGRDIDLICHAIANHVSGEEIQNAIDATLCTADKVDIGANRIKHPVTKFQQAQKNLKRVNCYVDQGESGTITINYEADDNFDPFAFLKGWPEGYKVPHKAANFLERPFAIFLNKRTQLWSPDKQFADVE